MRHDGAGQSEGNASPAPPSPPSPGSLGKRPRSPLAPFPGEPWEAALHCALTQALDVEEEVKCPICHEYLTNAVSVDCGHNYCQTCILRHCSMKEDFGEEVTCPLCQAPIQRENIRPNWPLRNLVEMIKHFPLRLPEENLCTKHEKKLSLFCTEDGELVCIHCKRSSEHRAHNVLLLEEAVEQYKEQSQSHLEFLKKEKKKLEEQKRAKEWRIENCLVQLEQEKKRIRSDFERMQKFLEEKQQLWVDQLEELEEELKKMQDKHLAKVSKEFSRLTALVAEMEEMCLQPESKFLQVRLDTKDPTWPGSWNKEGKSSDLRMHMRNCKGRGSILWGVGRMPGFKEVGGGAADF
uniref:RING-type E3 ubiquitin transferase n=1 Tax=Varanus komodoensis TaxID=61221 RepID=A0A8D2IQM0_VARKO